MATLGISTPPARESTLETYRRLALWACIAIAGALSGAWSLRVLRRAASTTAAPVAIERPSPTLTPYASAVHALARIASTCSSDLRILGREHPASVARTVLLEEGRIVVSEPRDAPAELVRLLDQRDAALDRMVSDVDRLAPETHNALGLATALTANAHRTMLRLCLARDAARGVVAVARR
jgi:hypothetical protein